jgi:hypothetical protein
LITTETLERYYNIGFLLVPLNEIGASPVIQWSDIYNNPNFWSVQKLKEYSSKFHNIATTFGESTVRDLKGKKLFLYCLDIDSEQVLKRLLKLLEEWKLKTFVTKTQKDCGSHVYWFEHNSENPAIVTEDCKKGFEFEIKCGKALCTLPPSRHRDNPLFHYENVGQPDRIMTTDGLYQQLVSNLLADCIKRSKKQVPNKYQNKSSETNKAVDDTNKLDVYISIPPSKIAKKIILTDQEIKESVQCLLTYYKEKARHSFALGFSGLSYKEHIDEVSAAAILASICKRTNDSEVDERLDTLHRTYVIGGENGSDSITGKTKLKEVIMYLTGYDDESADNVIKKLLRIWNKKDYCDNKCIVDNNTKNDNKRHPPSTISIERESSLLGINNPVEYAISVINKTVKCDDSLVRAVFYAGCSTWTFDPINLGISAPTSEGKTYTVLQVLQGFPKKDVKYIGSMSPKVIIRQDSILVDANTLRPIQGDINALRKEIKREKKNEKRRGELEEKLQGLLDNARPLIDLRGKIYVFLEPPNPELWNIIKPIMSHDDPIIEHPYVESNTFQGIHVRSIITLGFPTFIFCTARDESRWEQWQEIVSRSLIMSPNMTPMKYRESTILSAQQIGLPTAMQEASIRSRKEMDIARKCLVYLKNSIARAATEERKEGISENYEIAYNNPVWIPYYAILGTTLPAEKGTEMRTNRRLLSLIRIIALTKANQRYQLVFDNQILTVAAPEDLTEALYIMQNSSGLPPYKVKFFNEILYPAYKRKLEERLQEQKDLEGVIIEGDNKLIRHDHHVIPSNVTLTLTTNEICDYHNIKNPQKPINSDNLRKTYLNELVSAGYIEALDVKEGNTKKVYYPIIFPLEGERKAINEHTTEETNEFETHPEFFIHYKINVPTYSVPLHKDWLNFEVLRLWKCRIDISNGHPYSNSLTSYDSNLANKEAEKSVISAIQFLDKERKEEGNVNSSDTYYNNRKMITMTDFVQKYNRLTDRLSRHFSRPIFEDYCDKIFGKIQYLNAIINTNTIKTGTSSNSSVS